MDFYSFTYIFTPYGWKEFFTQEKVIKAIDIISKQIETDEKKIKVFPPKDLVYNALDSCTPSGIKCIIIGQDPYHTSGAAMGLAFSHFLNREKIQPSLMNIYKEMESEGLKVNWKSGDLTKWADQGVFLINTALTVRKGEARSHLKIWSSFTKYLFEYISKKVNKVVLICWGVSAQSFIPYFEKIPKKYVIASSHPSPFSANVSGTSAGPSFFGSKPFSRTNNKLKEWGRKPINWNLS